MLIIDIVIEVIVYEIVRIILDVFELLENYGPFLFDFLPIKNGFLNKIGENVDRFREMLIEDAGIVAGMFLGREGIQVAPERFKAARDLLRGIAHGSLERHMLGE